MTSTGANSGSYHYDPSNQWSANRKQSFVDLAEEIREEEVKEHTYTEEDIIAVYQAAKNGFMLKEILTALKEKK